MDKLMRLKDYLVFEVWKVIDKGTVSYALNDLEGNNINYFSTLEELKQFADKFFEIYV